MHQSDNFDFVQLLSAIEMHKQIAASGSIVIGPRLFGENKNKIITIRHMCFHFHTHTYTHTQTFKQTLELDATKVCFLKCVFYFD